MWETIKESNIVNTQDQKIGSIYLQECKICGELKTFDTTED